MDRKEEIYEKALKLFIEGGYDHTPMSRIANEVGLSKAGLYHYFPSKKHLLFLIHEHYLKTVFIPILDKAEKISDPEKRIVYFLKNYTNLMTEDDKARVLVHEGNSMEPEHYKKVLRIWKRSLDLIRGAISEIEISGKSKKLNKTFAAFAAIGMCSWTVYWFDYSRKEHSKELSETFAEIFLKGFLKDGEKL